MAQAVGQMAAKKLLGKQMDKYKGKKVAGSDDPYFAYVTGKNGKKKKVKKQIPYFVPEHDAHVLRKCKSRAYHLDMSLFNFCGIRFGWSAIWGLIPGFGDAFDCFMAYRLVEKCQTVTPGILTSADVNRMRLNIIIDFLVGLVPFLGDLADAVFRCNTRNVSILEQRLLKHYGPDNKEARETAGYELFEDDPDYKDPIPQNTRPGGTRDNGRMDDDRGRWDVGPDLETGVVQPRR